MSSTSVGMSDLSDEILLCILRHLPLSDLLMNVAQVSDKFRTLCHDKSLLTNVSLSEDYMVSIDMLSTRRLISCTVNHELSHCSSLVSPGKQFGHTECFKAPGQTRAVSQPQRLLLAHVCHGGAPLRLPRGDAPGRHRLPPLSAAPLPHPLLPLPAQVASFRCEGRLQPVGAHFRGGGLPEPPVGAEADPADAELWRGAVLCPTPQVRTLGFFFFLELHT